MRSHDPRQRDQGLARVSRITRWTAAVSAVAAGAFAIAAARPHLPKVHLPSVGGAANPGDGAGSGDVQANGGSTGQVSPDNGGLVPPSQAPAPSYGGGAVSSGAS